MTGDEHSQGVSNQLESGSPQSAERPVWVQVISGLLMGVVVLGGLYFLFRQLL